MEQTKWTDRELIDGLRQSRYLNRELGLRLNTQWIEDKLTERGINSDYSDKELLYSLMKARNDHRNVDTFKMAKWVKSRGLLNLMKQFIEQGQCAEFDEYGNLVPFSG